MGGKKVEVFPCERLPFITRTYAELSDISRSKHELCYVLKPLEFALRKIYGLI